MALTDTLDAVGAVVEVEAIGAGGLWAAWTFHKLQSARAAEVRITSGVAAARESERRLLSQQPNLDITFSEMTEHDPPGARGGFLVVSVELRNSGIRNLEVFFERAALGVGRFQTNGTAAAPMLNVHRTAPQFLPDSGDELEVMSSRIFRASQQRTVTFVVPVPEPGPYLVQFRTIYRPLPFEGETESTERNLINALQQRIVSITGTGAA